MEIMERRGTPRKSCAFSLAAGISTSLAAMLADTAAAADTGFFKGKTVTYIVATAPGGGYDFHGRLVSEYMQRHLPGSTFVVKSMPGAGHIIGANYIYASTPDGPTLGTFNTGLLYNQLTKLQSTRFDFAKFSWLGKGEEETRVFLATTQSSMKRPPRI